MNRDFAGRQIALHLIGKAKALDPYGPGKKRSAAYDSWEANEQIESYDRK